MKISESEAAEYFRLIAESSEDAIVGMTLDGRVKSWSRAAERALGFSSADAVGKSLSIITPSGGERERADYLGRVRHDEIVERLYTRLRRVDGSTIDVRMSLSPVRDRAGEVGGCLAIFRDLSESAHAGGGLRREQECVRLPSEEVPGGTIEDVPRGEEAENARQRSEHLSLIGTFAARVAHQINNPLGGILMAAQHALATQESPDSSATMRQALEDIEVDVRRCADVVRNILRFARQDARETTACTLDELVRSAVRLTREDAGDHVDVIFVEAQGELPEVLVTRTEMEQAISNILRSAISSLSEDIRVVIQTDCTDYRALLIIRGDGEGIPEGRLEYLSDPFYMTRGEMDDSALGLSMAHSIVTAHGGTIEVTSSHNSGTTVTIELPLRAQDLEDPR